MKELKAVCFAWIIATLIVLIGVGGRYLIEHPEYNEPIRDTVFDTIPYYKPVPRDSLVIKYITDRLPNAGNDDKEDNFPITDSVIADSSDVVIPITQKTYTDDSTYMAYISGYMTSLDSLMILNREIVTTMSPCPVQQNKKWSIGVQVGYGVTFNNTPQFTPYIGIGLSYKLFNF